MYEKRREGRREGEGRGDRGGMGGEGRERGEGRGGVRIEKYVLEHVFIASRLYSDKQVKIKNEKTYM